MIRSSPGTYREEITSIVGLHDTMDDVLGGVRDVAAPAREEDSVDALEKLVKNLRRGVVRDGHNPPPRALHKLHVAGRDVLARPSTSSVVGHRRLGHDAHNLSGPQGQ
jgi:hypothetical protein